MHPVSIIRLVQVTRYLCCALFLSVSLLAGEALAKPKKGASPPQAAMSLEERLHKSFMSLRNTDPTVTRMNEWIELRRQYEAVAPSAASASLLLDAAMIARDIARATRSTTESTEAVRLFKQVAARFPAASVADDALVYAAEVEAGELEDAEAAEATYKSIIARFPESDMAVLAAARLSGDEVRSGGDTEIDRQESGEYDAVVVLDPGHGGDDYGAQASFGLLEKDVALAVALEVQRLLQQGAPVKVVLTRRDDRFMPLLERVAFANQEQADVFVSLHVNASGGPPVSGAQAYVLASEGDEASRLLAERENRSGNEEISDLDFMLSDLTQNAKEPESLRLAGTLQRHLIAHAKKVWPEARDLGVKKAPFYVLVGAHMPCVLMEMFFIDHPTDATRLADPTFRKALAGGLSRGIEDFLRQEGVLK